MKASIWKEKSKSHASSSLEYASVKTL